jgi:MFS family permease
VLLSSLAAERLAKRRPQRTLIMAGLVITVAGIGLLLGLVGASSRVIAFAPGLFLIGVGLGVMLTPSVNVVQSAFPEQLQGEISGLSRSVSNLGSSFGTAIAGTILVSDLASGNDTYVLAMVVLAAFALVGLAAATLLPTKPEQRGARGTLAAPMRSMRLGTGSPTSLCPTFVGKSCVGPAEAAARSGASPRELVAPGDQPVKDEEVEGEDRDRPERKDEHDEDGHERADASEAHPEPEPPTRSAEE